jgi:putative ABC transport system permease protein
VRRHERNAPVFDVRPLPEHVASSVAPRRLAMLVLTGFAALALVLALLGTYGVISYAVQQRTQEIGIRLALGARPGDVVRMVVGGGLALAVVGLAIGAAGALGAGRVLASLLYGVGSRDPLTMAGALGVLLAITALASWIPARRAARLDPVRALRAE